MLYAGIDLGSRTAALVIVDENGKKVASRLRDTGFDPLAAGKEAISGLEYDRILATGYGRNLFELEFDAPTVTEIKAHAKGASALFPDARGVLDIGGQDSKAIALADNGRVIRFEMNDRCAAGTGKFLEVMARALGFELDTFADQALKSTAELAVSSMCTVFAESEVTSLIAKGEDRRAIARGLHHSVVRRSAAMLNRVVAAGDVVFTGGVANNACICAMLEDTLQRKVLIPEEPQLIGAYGAALLALASENKQ